MLSLCTFLSELMDFAVNTRHTKALVCTRDGSYIDDGILWKTVGIR
jgi:hypothetical protein